MFCTYCGKPNEDDAAFCVYCGKPIGEDDAQEAPSAGYAVQQTAKMQAQAPAQIPARPAGGYSSQPQAYSRTSNGTAGKNSRTAIIVIAIVAVVAVIAAIAVFALGLGGNLNAGPSNPQQVNASANSSTTETHKIVFEASGAQTTYGQTEAKAGDTIVSPTDPVKSGYDFGGWYRDSDYRSAVEFPYTVSDADPATIIFYAKWNEQASVGSGSTGGTAYTDFVFPDSSDRYLRRSELNGMSKFWAQRAINEIYARHGYIFQKNEEERAYFESRSWYQGYETNQDKVKAQFNDYEKANEKLLSEYRDDLIAAYEAEGDAVRMNAAIVWDECGWTNYYPSDNYAFMHKVRTNASSIIVMRLADVRKRSFNGDPPTQLE